MSILTRNQYNLGMDKYKLLSSTSGVGAIIAAKTGNYILLSSLNKWPFIKSAQEIISYERETNMATLLAESTKRIKNELGLNTVDDERFVGFLKISENLSGLLLLLPIPEISLNDFFNTPEWKNHPIKQSITNAVANNYMVQATHFPKWFVGKNKKLQTLDKWRADWGNLVQKNTNVKTNHFAPPRDFDFEKSKNVRRKTDAEGNYETMDIYNELTQTNLALICEHGHLMDIPWSKYINSNNFGNDSVNLDDIEDCCANPALLWTESTNKSEGFENVYIDCTNCGKKKNLGGINSFKCLCHGHKPWEIKVDGAFTQSSSIPHEICSFKGNRGVMQVSLVTANRMYYATGKNSLYIPLELKPEGFENQDLMKVLTYLKSLFENDILEDDSDFELNSWIDQYTVKPVLKNSGVKNAFFTNENIALIIRKIKSFILKDFLRSAIQLIRIRTEEIEDVSEWFNTRLDEDFLINDVGLDEKFVQKNLSAIKNQLSNQLFDEEINDSIAYDDENYRLYEYKCFSDNSEVAENGLKFNNVILNDDLTPYFTSIKQVAELKLTQVQLSFNRNKPRVAFQDQNGNIDYSSDAKKIFEGDASNQYVLPAVQNYGEGIFFQFNEDNLKDIVNDDRFQNILNKNLTLQDQGYGTWEMLNRCGQKYFIVHSFSHLIMRELEFACGYPTASLKERLYISSEQNEFMAGILIYTTDGSEGSMGGLVSQASEYNIEKLIKNALLRGVDCSSDPLCWESEGQGLFDFNLAACFSCSLVAETACEAMNLGLDRRILIDEEFGYFKSLLNLEV